MSDPSALDFATTVAFADDPLVAGVSTIGLTHLQQLRTAVNALRAVAGLSPAAFSTVAAGYLVSTTEVTELRTALSAAHVQLGFGTPSFTDPLLVPQSTLIRAIHFNELRGGVR